MKIISKYKDYYDYLTGIYGIDEKLVLDRRELQNFYISTGRLRFYIAGYIVEGLYIKDNFYYGEKLTQFERKHITYFPSTHWDRNYNKSIWIDQGIGTWIYVKPVKDKDNINIKENCPIIYKDCFGLFKYPQLSKFKLASFIPPETMYKWLEEWLSARITDKETHVDIRNDVSKLQDKGFDKKYSFRPKIKK